MRSLKVLLIPLVSLGLIGLAGGSSLLMADQNDIAHQTHLTHARGPGITSCGDCHTGTPETSGNVDNTSCNSCHSPNGAYGWTGAELRTTFWAEGAYDSNGNIRDMHWCAACHDDEASTINGMQAKQITGNDDGMGNGDNGYFISGHGFKCTACHDADLQHIDEHETTYTPDPIEEPHPAWETRHTPEQVGPRSFTKGYRLKLVEDEDTHELTQPFRMPRLELFEVEQEYGTEFHKSQFRGCYQCHSEEWVMGGAEFGPKETSPLRTYNVNLSPKGVSPDGHVAYPPPYNTHFFYHIYQGQLYDSDGREETSHGTGSAGLDSYVSCVTCHDTHGRASFGGRPTYSMTRKDLGITHDRDDTGWFGYIANPDYTIASGDDLYCQSCHTYDAPYAKYYYLLGTAPPEEPALWSELGEMVDITNPEYGDGGVGMLIEEDDFQEGKYGNGVSIDENGEFCKFPSSNLNPDMEVVDLWYKPGFNFATDTGNHYLFYLQTTGNSIEIKVAYGKLTFQIESGGSTHTLQTDNLNWDQGSLHQIVCTYGPNGMQMYLDRQIPDYSVDDGLTYRGGLGALPTYLYVGNHESGAYPADGIIDELKIYGFQYQKDLAFWSKMGSVDEIENPVIGYGGMAKGSVAFSVGNDGNGAFFDATYNGVVKFPTANLNAAEDTIDLWFVPGFYIPQNSTDKKFLFYCYQDGQNLAFIKFVYSKLLFKIVKNGVGHKLKTKGLTWQKCYGDYCVLPRHIVFCWGSEGMHIYLDGKEAEYANDQGVSYTGGLGTLPTNFQIGNKSKGAGKFVKGVIDEIRIYGYQETDFPLVPTFKEPSHYEGSPGSSCLPCHAQDQSHATHFDTTGKGPGIPGDETGCPTCHGPTVEEFADGEPLATTEVCDDCHSEGGAFNGVQMGKDSWENGVYDANMELKDSKYNWCLSCHDDNPHTTGDNESSYIEGVSAPNIAGDENNGNNYGFNITGHNSTGRKAVNCLSCHDANKKHIDGNPRTYEINEIPNPDVVINPYCDSYRLKDINGQPSMKLPRPMYEYGALPINHWEDFALCLSCHDRYEVISGYAYTNFRRFNVNAHLYHLITYAIYYDSDWDRIVDSTGSCIHCHNVHGSPTKAMIRHGELISEPGINKVPALNFAYLDPPSPGTRNPSTILEDSIGGDMDYAGLWVWQNYVCNACHFAISYERTPYLGPKLIDPKADPDTVPNDGSGSTLITAYVFDPDGDFNPPTTGSIKVDLSAISGSSNQDMYDDGPAGGHGDVTAGDGIYSYRKDIPNGISDMAKSLTITVTDGASNTDQADAILKVIEPGCIYIDNLEGSFTGDPADWFSGTGVPGYYPPDYQYHYWGAGSDTFTWTITASGTYEVFARWTEHSNRAPDAQYTIYHDGVGSPAIKTKDQRDHGGEWNSLNTYTFDGVNDRVELVENATGIIVADAIKLKPQP